jgi:glutathione S-transferase
MRIYHRERAGRPIRLIWTLEELDLPYELTIMNAEEGKAEDHLARHPLGRVPVLEDDEGPLFESTALCLHVADLAPEAGLSAPSGSRERALIDQWAIYAMTEIEPPALQAWQLGEKAPEVAEAAGKRAAAAVDAVVAELDGREYLVADRFTVADIVVSEVVRIARRIGIVEVESPIRPYLTAMKARPAYQRAEAIAYPEPVA